MVRSLFIMVAFGVVSGALFPLSIHAEEDWNPHREANECLSQACETQECQDACDELCASCHGLMSTIDLSGATAWNNSGMELAKIFPSKVSASETDLSKTCLNCHVDHYSADNNHPVEIQYPPEDKVVDYLATPDGPYLLCDQDGDCTMSCVTCHKVHPDEEEGEQVVGLLRVSTVGSELCLRCHGVL